ncbi:hypothetical protein ACFPN1_12635 [Lysobacter yangpyeongensis]|uniref:Uncharacterized protein n=1 Tax=Lysobacter yangpyeongensis TaxID=346182 RepID=A0ABW0SPB3_9GAMM
MEHRGIKASRTRNWLALLLMAVAVFTAERSQAATPAPAELHVPR